LSLKGFFIGTDVLKTVKLKEEGFPRKLPNLLMPQEGNNYLS
jgi:hypothetical protein